MGGYKSQSAREILDIGSDGPTAVQKDKLYVNESVQLESPSKKVINEEENSHWKFKLKKLKEEFASDESDFRSMASSVTSLSNSLKKRSEEAKEKDSKLTKFEKKVRDIEKQLSDKSQMLRKIEERVSKLENSSPTKKGNVKAIK